MSKIQFGRGITSFLAVNIVMLIVVVMVFTTMMDLRRERDSLEKSLEQQGLVLADSLSKAVARPLIHGDVATLRDIAGVAGSQLGLSYIQIFSADGDALISAGDGEFTSSADDFGMMAVENGAIVHRLDDEVFAFASPVESGGQIVGGVQFGYSFDGLAVRNASIVVQRIWQTLLLVIAGLVVAYLMGQYIVRPLKRLNKATRQMLDGDLDSDVATDRADEIGALSLAISEISDKLQGKVSATVSSDLGEILSLQTQLEKEISKRRKVEDDLQQADEAIQDERLERIQLKEQLNQSQNQNVTQGKDSVESQVRSIAHDINNLLMPIKGHTEMAKRRLQKGDPIHTNLDEIQNASDRISGLVERLRDYMKGNSSPEEPRVEDVTVRPAESVVVWPSVGSLDDGVILLVDDETTVRGIAAHMLRDLGYTVLEADGGEEALKLVQAYPDTRIRLLLTDVVMPGMPGKELAAELKAIQPETRVLFMSGFNVDSLIEHGDLSAKANFVQKPVSIDSLKSKIDNILEPGVSEVSGVA